MGALNGERRMEGYTRNHGGKGGKGTQEKGLIGDMYFRETWEKRVILLEREKD